MKAERKLYVPSKAKKHEENTHYNRKYWKPWIFVLKNRKDELAQSSDLGSLLMDLPVSLLCFPLSSYYPFKYCGERTFLMFGVFFDLKPQSKNAWTIFNLHPEDQTFSFFMLGRNMKMEGLDWDSPSQFFTKGIFSSQIPGLLVLGWGSNTREEPSLPPHHPKCPPLLPWQKFVLLQIFPVQSFLNPILSRRSR